MFATHGSIQDVFAAKSAAALPTGGALDSNNHRVIRSVAMEGDLSLVESGWMEVREGEKFFARPYAHRLTFTRERAGTVENAPEYLGSAGDAPLHY